MTGSLHFVAGSLWGALAGLFVLVGFYNFAHSLRTGSISINAPVFRLSFVLTAALAVVLLGSRSRLQVAGLALALAAVWLLLGAPAPVTPPAGARAALRSRACSSPPCRRGRQFHLPLWGLRAGASPGSLIVAQAAVVRNARHGLRGLVDRRIRPSGAALRYAPRAAVVLALAFAFMVEGMARAEASVVVPIAQMGFVVTALLGFLFLREPFTARKGAGLAAALAALASLAYG